MIIGNQTLDLDSKFIPEKSSATMVEAGSGNRSKETLESTIDELEIGDIKLKEDFSVDMAENEETGEADDDEQDRLRLMDDEEKRAVCELAKVPDDIVDSYLLKNRYWESLQWWPLEKTEKAQDLFLDKSIYLLARTPQGSCLWYVVPIKDLLAGGGTTELQPVLGKEPQILQKAVALPPDRIVALGDGSKVLWLNVKDEEPVWREYPRMAKARDDPAVAVLDEKIYVFGGTSEDNDVERFDVKLECWEILYYTNSTLSFHVNIPGVFSEEHGGKQHFAFFSHRGRSIRIFDVETGTLDFGERVFPDLYKGCVAFNGILYAYLLDTNDVRAYDLSTKRWLPGPVIEASFFVGKYVNCLLHIGGDRLCVVDNGFVGKWLQLDFRVFKVGSKQQINGGVKGEFIPPSRSYCLHGGHFLWNSLII